MGAVTCMDIHVILMTAGRSIEHTTLTRPHPPRAHLVSTSTVPHGMPPPSSPFPTPRSETLLLERPLPYNISTNWDRDIYVYK